MRVRRAYEKAMKTPAYREKALTLIAHVKYQANGGLWELCRQYELLTERIVNHHENTV